MCLGGPGRSGSEDFPNLCWNTKRQSSQVAVANNVALARKRKGMTWRCTCGLMLINHMWVGLFALE